MNFQSIKKDDFGIFHIFSECKNYSSSLYIVWFKIVLLKETFSSQIPSSLSYQSNFSLYFSMHFVTWYFLLVSAYFHNIWICLFLSQQGIPSILNFSNYSHPSFFQVFTKRPFPPWNSSWSSMFEKEERRGNIYWSPALYQDLCWEYGTCYLI